MVQQPAMRNHWWWRPGWELGRKMYTWHITFDDQSSFHEIVKAYQSALKDLPGLDLIPPQWLHLTMQGVGFVDEVSVNDAQSIVDAARSRCASLAPLELTFGTAKVEPEAIMFAVHPADRLREIRTQVRAAIVDVWSEEKVPEGYEWNPHVSIAYSNAAGPAEPFLEALSHVDAAPAALSVRKVELIVLNRDNRMYEWETFSTVALGAQ